MNKLKFPNKKYRNNSKLKEINKSTLTETCATPGYSVGQNTFQTSRQSVPSH